jgi:hypothetical protein
VYDELGIDLRSEVRLVGFDVETAQDAGAQVGGAFDGADTAARSLTRLDSLFGPLAGDDTLSAVTMAPPLPAEAVAELQELFGDTGAIERPDPTPGGESVESSDETSRTSSGDTPVADVVDISTAAQVRNAHDTAAGVPVVIDDSEHLLPHERTEGSASLTLDPTSPFIDGRRHHR